MRLTAQADEAEIYGHSKIASELTNQIVKCADENLVRGSNEPYKYTREDLMDDIRKLVWSSGLRVFDYYEHLPDARDINDIVDELTESVVGSFESIVKGVDVGHYEPGVLGEDKSMRPEHSEVNWDISLDTGEEGHPVVVEDNDEIDETDEDLHNIVEDEEEENKEAGKKSKTYGKDEADDNDIDPTNAGQMAHVSATP